jgi:hypothetical protein
MIRRSNAGCNGLTSALLSRPPVTTEGTSSTSASRRCSQASPNAQDASGGSASQPETASESTRSIRASSGIAAVT